MKNLKIKFLILLLLIVLLPMIISNWIGNNKIHQISEENIKKLFTNIAYSKQSLLKNHWLLIESYANMITSSKEI